MNAIAFPFIILSLLDGQPEPTCATLPEIRQAETVIINSNCMNPTEERMKALNVIKSAIDRIDPHTYVDFCEYGTRYPEEKLAALYEKHPAFYWYDHSFERVLEGVRNDMPPKGTVYLWHVYNMGYVVRTSTACFAIDLHHRRAEELVPYLDFCCITHNHDDHYTERFAAAMDSKHKPVITNFYPNAGYPKTDAEAGYSKEPTRTMVLGDITITTFESDHNKKLRKFVMPVQITCGKEPDACVIFSSGDSCFPEQLNPTAPKIDFWLVHPYVGLDIAEGAAKLKPRMTLVSHLMEYHHFVNQWRWTFRQGYDAAKKVWDLGMDAVVPLSGDKIIWTPKAR